MKKLKLLLIISIATILSSCLCRKHTGAIVKDKIQSCKYKVSEEIIVNDVTNEVISFDEKNLWTFNYIVLKEENKSITVRKMSSLRLKFYEINRFNRLKFNL